MLNRLPSARALFQTRDLTLLWAGQVISMSGDAIYQIALIWLALELTASKAVTGLVAMSAYLPALLLSLVAGVVADRTDRRRVMLLADAIRAIAILGIPIASVAGWLTPGLLVANAFLIAGAAAFFNPAKDAIIPQLVPHDGLMRANSLIQTSWQVAMLLGPALAAALLTMIGLHPLFLINSLAFVLSFITIWLLRPTAATGAPQPRTQPSEPASPLGRAAQRRATLRAGWEDIRIGLRFALRHPVLLPLLLITIADNLFIMGPAIVGIPVLVRETLGGTASDYALVTACLAAGMLVSTAGLLAWGQSWPKGRLLLIGMLLDGFTFIPFLWVSSVIELGIYTVIHSLAIPLLTVTRASLVQEVVPPEMRGRVFALISLAVVGMSAVSSALTGLVLEWIPAPALFAGIGVLGGLCGVAGLRFARSLRAQP